MKTKKIAKLLAEFGEAARKADGVEYWLARDIQKLLGYDRWENFAKVVRKAATACENSGCEASDHFLDVAKTIPLPRGAEREIKDVALTRYACFLIAQNGDPTKDQIAFAQTYFAVQTRKQEIIEKRLTDVDRLNARRKLTLSEKELSGIINDLLGDSKSFAVIRSKGDTALFGGYSTGDMKQRLNVPKNRALADFLPTITIKAKDFANEITNFNIKKSSIIKNESAITREHVKSNEEVRTALIKRHITPEDLPPDEDVKKMERRLKSEEKKLPKTVDRLEVREDEVQD